MQVEKYIGLQYKEKGRDFSGVDCYGLVRLFYKNEYQIDLPSFTSEYTQDDTSRIQELIAQYKEGWEPVENPVEGSIVLFRVLGTESHVGVVINDLQFLHVRENQDSAIENFSSPFWKKRVVGYFKYSEKKSVVLNAVPHPLRTERYTMPIVPGTTLKVLAEGLTKEYNIAEELKSKVSVMVNGMVIPQEKWQYTILKEGDTVEYRSVPTGSAGRLLMTIALVYVAMQTGYWAAGVEAGTAMTAGQTATYVAASTATMMVGTALINAIAPIRPPVDNTQDPGSAERQLMVNGGSNQQRPYSAIPVVLGKVRVTPPLGSTNYLTYENERDSYLSMLLVWGYGPLSIDLNTLKIGDTLVSGLIDINDPKKYKNITLDRKTEPTQQTKDAFDAIYGKDVTQVQTSKELTCDGNPESTVTPGPWFEAATNEVTTSATVALHFPQGLRKVVIKGAESGASVAVSVNFRIEYSINAGSTWSLLESFSIGGDTAKKDAFTYTKNYDSLPTNSGMVIRVRRETGDNIEDNDELRYYFTSILQSVTFTRNTKPVIDPVGVKLAKSAIKINATEELNGNIQGISAVVQTWCKSWNGVAWVDAATSNPADLFRYVLEHPANPRRVTNASTQINLTALQYFASYCTTHGFEYNSVMGESRSVLEVLRDICAAGRASPALIDGKWSVVIDDAKPNIIQHFTPHNSWGFEGTKALPKRPDGLRVTYYDQDQDYQEAEIIVYDIDKSASNSTLFESITLPGVTKKSLVIDHAKWHMAQIKLRPEVYTLNSDIEYLVCNRGDRVKVMHDVPMWGLGSGRVRNRISSTSLELDEDVVMRAGVTYTIRFRSKSGNSVVRNVVPKSLDGYYSVIDLSSAVTTDEADVEDLFLFGELQQESQDLMVLSIEPSTGNSARITLVDYGVTNTYNIFTQYQNLTNGVVFESQLTLSPRLQLDSFGNKTPDITGFVSDESVMERISKSVYRYNINVAYVNAFDLPVNTEYVELNYDLLSATDSLNSKTTRVLYQKGSASITDVYEGETYKVRARYVGRNGFVGPWSAYANHTVVGKTNPPSQVTEFSVSSDKSSGQLLLSWHNNLELDVAVYEIRTEDAGWGVNDYRRVFYGDSTKAFIKYATNGSATFYIKAIDSSGNYSQVASVVSFAPVALPNITDVTYSYADTALTSATVTLNWSDVTTSQFDIAYYEVSYDSVVRTTKSNSITLPADWTGDRVFTVKVVDMHGNKSSGYSEAVAKIAPNAPADVRAQVIDNTVMLYWTVPERTSLPVDHILIKKGTTWNSAVLIGDKKGAFTTITENQGGTYTYWLACVDTEGAESVPASVTTVVSEPPDFVFHGEFISDYSGTKSSASSDGTRIALPVNTTETWQEHFANRSWSTPQDQVNAGYPIFIQPSGGSGYYEEVFDFGQPLASSRVSLIYKGTVLAGSPTVSTRISLSLDNSTYVDYNGVTDVYGLNFRYVKIRISATELTDVGLYEITDLSVKLDAKLKNDAGNTYISEYDANGTIVNLNKDFIDVQSIVLSSSGTEPVMAVYDFKDAFVSGSYSITSNVCTVNINNHDLITGQKVKLFFSNGVGLTGTYIITDYTTNSFSVAMLTANGSGTCSMYPQSFRAYLFKNSGNRQSATASWSIKGY